MMPATFDRSVFLNCPFDDEYAPLLQSVAFCIVYMGFFPRLAPENPDNGAARLERIIELIRSSKYGVHDLSRCRAAAAGELARMNMPFELGLDHGCRVFGAGEQAGKSVLILDENRHQFQKTLSDIGGWDIKVHGGDFEQAVRHVRTWLIAQAGAANVGAARVLGQFLAFQEWYWDMQLAAGSSEEDIRAYPTDEMIRSMHVWMDLGQPA